MFVTAGIRIVGTAAWKRFVRDRDGVIPEPQDRKGVITGNEFTMASWEIFPMAGSVTGRIIGGGRIAPHDGFR